jgi:hypothetical protein
MLGHLRSLLSLSTFSHSFPAEALGSIAQLTQLTSLQMLNALALPSSTLLLPALQQLRHLALSSGGIGGIPLAAEPPMLSPPPASFPFLEGYCYRSWNVLQVSCTAYVEHGALTMHMTLHTLHDKGFNAKLHTFTHLLL